MKMADDNEVKYREYIFNAIDRLRQRKARPDIEHISNFIRRRHGLDFSQVSELVEKLVKDETLTKVEYKGRSSYRYNKTDRTWAAPGVNVPELSEKICSAIGSKKEGVGIEFIRDFLKKHELEINLSLDELEVIIKKEVAAGNLRTLGNGLYVLKCQRKRKFKDQETDENGAAEERFGDEENKLKSENADTVKNVKSKVKELKQVKKKRSLLNAASTISTIIEEINETDLCFYCGEIKNLSSENEIEETLVCQTCLSHAHPSCLDYNSALAARCRLYAWQCMDCKTCTICNDSGNAGKMLFCDSCDKGYHTGCHVPKIISPPTGAWVCNMCTLHDKKCLTSQNHEATSKTNSPMLSLSKDSCNESSDLPVSEAFNWSVQDVMHYFEDLGFSEEINVFKNQEIDGKSLLLLRREDVLTGLSLKLGPALKIYKYILRLQIGLSGKTAPSN